MFIDSKAFKEVECIQGTHPISRSKEEQIHHNVACKRVLTSHAHTPDTHIYKLHTNRTKRLKLICGMMDNMRTLLAEESISTLKFADHVKQVMAFVLQNDEPPPTDYLLVEQLQRENAQLSAMLMRLQATPHTVSSLVVTTGSQTDRDREEATRCQEDEAWCRVAELEAALQHERTTIMALKAELDEAHIRLAANVQKEEEKAGRDQEQAEDKLKLLMLSSPLEKASIISNMKVKELKECLCSLKIPLSGNKKVLQERLKDALNDTPVRMDVDVVEELGRPGVPINKENSPFQQAVKNATSIVPENINSCPDDEENFRCCLRSAGFIEVEGKTKDKKTENLKKKIKKNYGSTFLFVHHPNGSQKSPDFILYDILDNRIVRKIPFEVKGNKGQRIFLNDGWFDPHVVYLIILCKRPSKKYPTPECIVMMGRDIPSDSETSFRNMICQEDLETNKHLVAMAKKNGFSYEPYRRKGDKYNMGRILDRTDEEKNQDDQKVRDFIELRSNRGSVVI